MENKNMILGDNLENDFSPEDLNDLNILMKEADDLLKNYYFDGHGYRLVVKILNKSTNENPAYAKTGDSGFDLRANLPDGPVVIPAGKVEAIPTGLHFEVPYNFELQVRSRSGLALKNGVMVLNSPGTVDSGYRGEVKAIIFNTGAYGDFIVNHGDRICQGVVCPVIHNVKLDLVEELTESERGEDGFGSTKVQ